MAATPAPRVVRTIIFKEDETWYGVALECNITVEATSSKFALVRLHETAAAYVALAQGMEALKTLKQVPDPEYQALWGKLTSGEVLPKSIHVAFYGTYVIHP